MLPWQVTLVLCVLVGMACYLFGVADAGQRLAVTPISGEPTAPALHYAPKVEMIGVENARRAEWKL